MNIFALCGCAVTACVLIIAVRQYRPDIATVLSLAAGVVLFGYIISALSNTIDGLMTVAGQLEGFQDEAAGTLRAVGVCLVAQLAADVCRDAGESTTASRVELGGKAAALLMMLPVFEEILELSVNIING